jgi:hypothetical protein
MRCRASRSRKRGIHTEFDHYGERLGADHTASGGPSIVPTNLAVDSRVAYLPKSATNSTGKYGY